MSAYLTDLLLAGLALAIFAQAGVWLLLVMRVAHLHLSEWISAAFLLGLGAVSLSLLALAMLQLRLHLAWLLAFWLALWAALAAWQRHARLPWAWPQPRWTRPRLPGILTGLVLVLTLTVVIFRATFHPIFEWDSWAIWDLKAKAVFYQAGLFPYLTDAYYELSHLEYPLLYPLAATVLYWVLGRHSDIALTIPAVLYACASLLLYGSLRRNGAGRALAAAGGVAIAWVPNFLFWSQNFNADGPLAVYALASTLLAADYLRQPRRGTALMVGLLAGMTMQLKIEGVLLVLGLLPFVAWRALGRRGEWLNGGLILLASGSLGAAWFFFQRQVSSFAGHVTTDNLQSVIDNLDKLPAILTHATAWLTNWAALGGYTALLPALLVLIVLCPPDATRGLWLMQTAAAFGPALLFFLVFPQFITPDNFNRYLTAFLVVASGAVLIHSLAAWRSGGLRRRAAQAVLGACGGLILLGNLAPDFLPEAPPTAIYTARPLSTARYSLAAFSDLLPQLPHERRQLLDARSAQPAYAALLHVARAVSAPDENVALWVPPEARSDNFLLQRSYYLLYPRKIFLAATADELARVPLLGAVVRYDREDHPPGGVPVFAPEPRFGVHRQPAAAGSLARLGRLIRLDADFANGIRLVGLQPVFLTADSVLVIAWWQAPQAVDADLAVFVHAWQGETLASQHDSPPAFAMRPTAAWRASERIADGHPLTFPSGWQSIRTCVGLYRPADGARLLLSNGADMLCHDLNSELELSLALR